MAEPPKARVSLKEVGAAVRRMQAEGERLLSRIGRDAQAFATRSRRQAVTDLVADARRLQADLRGRAGQAIRDLDARRADILATLEEQASGLVEAVVRRLNLASKDAVADLHRRVAELAQRLDAHAAAVSAPPRKEVAELRARVTELEQKVDRLAKEDAAGTA